MPFFFNTDRSLSTRMLPGVLLWCILSMLTAPAVAQSGTAPLCTHHQAFIDLAVDGEDFLEDVIKVITTTLDGMAEQVYEFIIRDTSYQDAVAALVILYIAIYGAMIMFNMVSTKGGEAVLRLVKIGVLFSFVSPGGWAFFNDFVLTFFLGGLNEVITLFSNIALGRSDAVPDPDEPANVAAILAQPLGLVLSPQLYAVLLAMLFTGPYGWAFVLLMLWALSIFFFAILAALGTYLKALVGLYFLFALAPIFFAFLLFAETKHLCEGWLNQLIGFTLRPIFVFSFLGFFFVMMMAALQSILEIPVCYVRLTNIDLVIYDWNINIWRFSDPANPGQPHTGAWGVCGPEEYCGHLESCADCSYALFPVEIMDVVFLILVSQLAWHYTTAIEQMAEKFAGASGGISMTGQQVKGWFQSKGLTPTQLAGKSAGAVAGAPMVAVGGVAAAASGARSAYQGIRKSLSGDKANAGGGGEKANAAAAASAATTGARGVPGGSTAASAVRSAAKETGKSGQQGSPSPSTPGRGGGKRDG